VYSDLHFFISLKKMHSFEIDEDEEPSLFNPNECFVRRTNATVRRDIAIVSAFVVMAYVLIEFYLFIEGKTFESKMIVLVMGIAFVICAIAFGLSSKPPTGQVTENRRMTAAREHAQQDTSDLLQMLPIKSTLSDSNGSPTEPGQTINLKASAHLDSLVQLHKTPASLARGETSKTVAKSALQEKNIIAGELVSRNDNEQVTSSLLACESSLQEDINAIVPESI
jgi:hypothetical protein